MASVCLDVLPTSHGDAEPYLALSAQITGTQRSQHTSEMVNVLVKLHSIVADVGMPVDPREYCISTKEFFADEEGKLQGLQTGKLPSLIHLLVAQPPYLHTVRVEWTKDSGGRWKPEEMPGSEKYYPAELVFLALGFLGPQPEAIESLGVIQDARSNIKTPNKKYSTNVDGVFAAGDCRRGQSLIVWGIK